MTCDHCVKRVEDALSGLPGVYGTFVDLGEASAEVEYQEGKVTIDALVAAVKSAGYEATPPA
jgi:Cu+-exporting ATPase